MGDTPQNDDIPIGDLRRMLAEQTAKNEEQAAQLLAFQQDQQLRDAGFSHLSQRQRRTILRDMADDGVDFSAEAASDIAKEHGYPLTPTPPTTDNGNRNGQQGNGQGGQPQDTNQGQGQGGDQDVEDSLTAMDLMRKAQQMAAGNAQESDFETQIKATKSKEELTDLIRSKGARHGIVHEWDVP